MSDDSPRIRKLEARLAELVRERDAISTELASLKVASAAAVPMSRGSTVADRPPQNPAEKVALFLRLFRCRQSVYPKLWENPRKGTKGYSPACQNEWARGICQKPKVKCSECPHRVFPRLDEAAVEAHLRGKHTVGTYAIREDDTCTFLACDFDGTGWRSDILTYQSVGQQMGVQVSIERSRSGAGAHAWIFFSEPVPARLARALGTLILSRCGEVCHTLSLESYDRFFPNQDFIPKGGFGNLIALPLQKTPRDVGNTVFLDGSLQPRPDQWAYLALVVRLSLHDLNGVLSEFGPADNGRRDSSADASLNVDARILNASSRPVAGVLRGKTVEIIRGAQLGVPLNDVPALLVTALKRTASFPNPRFYELQRMRLQTYPNPRFIFSGEMRPDQIVLPRGVLDKVRDLLKTAGSTIRIRDARVGRKRIIADFKGVLTHSQEEAVTETKKYDEGILVAPPGSGKTVMGCALIARRKVTTLILVHRKQILDQWKRQLATFLGAEHADTGHLDGSRKRLTGKIDVVMLQALAKSDMVNEMSRQYTQVIVDECQHVPAASFEGVMKQLNARYVVGLTATPYRKDRLEKILFQQCGPVRHSMGSVDDGQLGKMVRVRETGLRPKLDIGASPPYHVFAELLASDAERNEIIVADVIDALKKGRFPLVLSDRKNQIAVLAEHVRAGFTGTEDKPLRLFAMDGQLSARRRHAMLSEITGAHEHGNPVVVLSTASLIGEGFDLPQLDTLVLAMPLSFKGRVVQYAGRLHRIWKGKVSVTIFDYVDSFFALSIKMYQRRLRVYRDMGYVVQEPDDLPFTALAHREGDPDAVTRSTTSF